MPPRRPAPRVIASVAATANRPGVAHCRACGRRLASSACWRSCWLAAAASGADHPRRVVPASAGVLTMIASCARFSGLAASAGAPGLPAPGAGNDEAEGEGTPWLI
jgi:hypothetical protein